MKNNLFKSFRFRMMLLFMISGLIAGAITVIIYFTLMHLYRENVLRGDSLHYLRIFVASSIGDFNAFLILFLPVFFVTFFLLTKNYGKLLDNISKGISEISNGNFDIHIAAKSGDEIGRLANDVNAAALKLKTAVQSGEFAKSSKDRLVINVAHDLRTPLTSINGYLNLILSKDSLTPVQTKHYAEIAYQKSIRMEKLIDELFAFSCYDYGESKPKKEKINLTYLIRQIMEEFYPAFSEKQIAGRIFMEQSPVFIDADGYMISRVFDNLIGNALRYGCDGKYIDVSLEKKDNLAICQITNYDSIIPSDKIEHIFESFYRVDESRSTDTGGSGLGLAIAKNIIELHGGTIQVTSSFEKTTFTFQLKAV